MKKIIITIVAVLTLIGCSSEEQVIETAPTETTETNTEEPIEDDEKPIENDEEPDLNNPVYLAENGITVKARDWAVIGDSGEIDGEIYTIVDRFTIREAVNRQGEVNARLKFMVTTKITDMSALFLTTPYYGNPNNSSYESNVITGWDVSNVTNMWKMFKFSSFNQPIDIWDVSNVTDMYEMFYAAEYFNHPLNSWDVSNTTWADRGLLRMFYAAYEFNQDLSSWDVSHITNMREMFYGATSFNQDLSSWDVSNVTNMAYMFYYATSYNQDLSSWDVNNVAYCDRFSQSANSWVLAKPNFTNCNP